MSKFLLILLIASLIIIPGIVIGLFMKKKDDLGIFKDK